MKPNRMVLILIAMLIFTIAACDSDLNSQIVEDSSARFEPDADFNLNNRMQLFDFDIKTESVFFQIAGNSNCLFIYNPNDSKIITYDIFQNDIKDEYTNIEAWEHNNILALSASDKYLVALTNQNIFIISLLNKKVKTYPNTYYAKSAAVVKDDKFVFLSSRNEKAYEFVMFDNELSIISKIAAPEVKDLWRARIGSGFDLEGGSKYFFVRNNLRNRFLKYRLDPEIQLDSQPLLADHPALITREKKNLRAVSGFDSNKSGSIKVTYLSIASYSNDERYYNLIPGDNFPSCYVLIKTGSATQKIQIKLKDENSPGVWGMCCFGIGKDIKVVTLEKIDKKWNVIMHSVNDHLTMEK